MTRDARKMAEVVAKEYGQTFDMLRGPARTMAVNEPRRMAIYILKQEGFSDRDIGVLFNRHRTQVSHVLEYFQGLLDTERNLQIRVELLRIRIAREGC